MTSILLILLYLQIVLSNEAYTCHKVISTPFKSTKDFVNCMTSKSFFDKYLKEVNGEEIEYIPRVNRITNQLTFPQTITYRAIPDIPYVPSFMLLKINIEHNWNRNGNTFTGKVSTKYITFNVNLSAIECDDDNIHMNLNGVILDKISIVPNNAMDLLLDQFGGIFKKISEQDK
mgnify:CR=1 FL=1